MNIYDKAHELARELKQCPEIIEFKKASEKVNSSDNSKKMLEDFRRLQIEAYTEQIQKGKISDELMEKLQNLGSVVSMNPDVASYLQAEARFGATWEDIMKILNEAVGIEMPLEK